MIYTVSESKYFYLLKKFYVQFYVIVDAMCSLVLETASLNNAISLNKV